MTIDTMRLLSGPSIGYFCDYAKNATSCGPPIDTTTIVSDLKPFPRYGFNQVQVLRAVYLTQNNATNLDVLTVGRFNRYQLAAFNFAAHAVAARPKLDLSSLGQFLNILIGPSHTW